MLVVQERDQVPLTSVEERLFAGLAAQAGLVLRGARLRAELEQRAEELSARADELRRLATAAGRRPGRRSASALERDIHDGAQQHLVALAVNLRLAQTLADRVARPCGAAAGRPGARGGRRDRDPASSSPAASTRRCSRRAGSAAALRAPSATARAGRARRRGRRPLPPRPRGGGVLLLPGGAPERRQALRARSRIRVCAARRDGDQLVLSVEDDGAGFDPRRSRPAAGWPTCGTGSRRVDGVAGARPRPPASGHPHRRPRSPRGVG